MTKSTKFPKSLFKYLTIILLLIFLISVSLCVLFCFIYSKHSSSFESNINNLKTEEYDSLLTGNIDISNFSTSDFNYYMNVYPYHTIGETSSVSEIADYISEAVTSPNTVNTIYLILDLYQIKKNCFGLDTLYQHTINKFVEQTIMTYPNIMFEIAFCTHSMNYWSSFSDKEVNNILNIYTNLFNTLSQYANTTVSFIGAEEWFICNPQNFNEKEILDELASNKMFLYTFGNHKYTHDEGSFEIALNNLKKLIIASQNDPINNINLSDWDIVFFGDSVIGNYTDRFSIPGVASLLSNSTSFNCGFGGTSATQSSDSLKPSFSTFVNCFTSQQPVSLIEGSQFENGFNEYLSTTHDNKKLCFVINFGLNDYFEGLKVHSGDNRYDTSTYEGSLRYCIETLKKHYPDCYILLMTPTFTAYYDYGEQITSAEGGQLTDYVNTVIQIANEFEIPYLNNYSDLGINKSTCEEFLADGCHPNDQCRMNIAKKIILTIDSLK